MKVSVLVMTYNHAGFIRQALDSVLMQTGCEFEVLISEDCSTDGTRQIVTEYQQRFPDTIRLLLSTSNLRSNAVVARGIHAARGEYVALLDGDDFWLDAGKLKKQAAFLDHHRDCALCFHNARVLQGGTPDPGREWTPAGHPEISTLEDIWCGNFIATCSVMFRRGLVPELPAWYDSFFPITDWPLHILYAERGNVGYIRESLGVYRIHDHGCFSAMSERRQQTVVYDFYRRLNECLAYKHDRLARGAMAKYFIEWAEEYTLRGDRAAARACFRYYWSGRPINKFVSLRRMLRNVAHILGPARRRTRLKA